MDSSSFSADELERWRDYFRSAKVSVFEVIHRAIDVAISDFPAQLKLERDDIAQRLFSSSSSSCLQIKKQQPTDDTNLQSQESSDICYSAANSLDHHPHTNDPSPVSSGIGDPVNIELPRVSRRRPIIRIKYRSKEIGSVVVEKSSSGCLIEKKSNVAVDEERSGLIVGDEKYIDQVKLEGAKRKLKDAYDRADLAKRVKRTQLLDFSQVRSLQATAVNKQRPPPSNIIKRRQQQQHQSKVSSLIRRRL